MIKERVLLLGCGGMLGKAVYDLFVSKYENVLATDIDLNESWISYLDFRDYKQVEKAFVDFQPNLVLHLGALTDLEYCEQNPENTWLTNALGPENTAILCKQYNVRMVYISTAGIFDGAQEYYTDFDQPNPICLYAKSKYYGECFVKNHLDNYFIFRAGWMMGGGVEKDKKFINKIFKQIKEGAKELYVVDDKLGTPTYTKDFALGIFTVIQSSLYGLYNQVCKGSCSRLDVAVEFVKLLGLENNITITTVSSDYFKSSYFAPRPASEKLVSMKLDARGLNVMRDWKICLEEYAQEFKPLL